MRLFHLSLTNFRIYTRLELSLPPGPILLHGANAQGAVGPNLTDAEWIHSDGSYDAIVKQVTTGVPKEQSKSGIPMPPKGGSTITDDEVKAVAAYVYSLSHTKPGT